MSVPSDRTRAVLPSRPGSGSGSASASAQASASSSGPISAPADPSSALLDSAPATGSSQQPQQQPITSLQRPPQQQQQQQQQPQQLIEIVNVSNKLVLDNVYLNSLHALRRIELRNTSPFRLNIKLRSNLGSQIAFQLTNENLPDHREQRRTKRLSRTNTTQATRVGSFGAGTPILAQAIASNAIGLGSLPSSASAAPERLSATTSDPSKHPRHAELSIMSLDSSMESFTSTGSVESPLFSPKMGSSSASTSSEATSTPPSSSPRVSIPSSPTLTTNTVEAAAMGLMSFGSNAGYAHGHQFNQLFNYVNHIDEVLLEAGQTQKIVIAFLPEVKGPRESVLAAQAPANSRLRSITGGRADDDDDDNHFAGHGEEDETHDFFEINGLIFFFAYKVAADETQLRHNSLTGQSDTLAAGTQPGEVALRKSRPTSASVSQPSQPHPPHHLADGSPPAFSPADGISEVIVTPLGMVHNGALQQRDSQTDVLPAHAEDLGQVVPAVSSDSNAAIVPATAIPDYQLAVKFRSRVCQSLLWTDIGSTGIIFDDCVVGGSYFKDFTIWNRSEIDLFWIINTSDLMSQRDGNWLQFTDYDTGEPLDFSPIPAYSHRRIRVKFKPRETGEFNYDLQIENQNDSANTVETQIHAIVRDVLGEELLSISCGNTLDFGDCCAGVWRKKRVTLRNMSDQVLDVSFSSDNSSVVFQLKIDDGTTDPAALHQSQQHQGHSGHHHHHYHHHHHHHQHLSQHGRGSGHQKQQQQQQMQQAVQQQSPTQLLGLSQRLVVSPELNPDDSGAEVLERPIPERLQEITTNISGTNSEFSPTQSISSSRASTPPPILRRRNDSGPFANATSMGSSTGALSSAVSGATGSLLEAVDLVRTLSNNSSIGRSEDMDSMRTREFSNTEAASGSTEEYMRIEELQLRPGTERTIEVCFKPERDPPTPDYRAGRLVRRNFRITILYTQTGSNQRREKKKIQAIARTCTSFIDVTPKTLNFGDTDVGTLKSLPIQITNCSDLPARVEMRFISKVLNTVRNEMTIPARQHIEVKIDIYPRKVNPDYRKQITVANLLNRDNDHTVDVSSTNIDKNRVTFHSLFYHLLTPSSSNFIDFGSAILNSPAVRTFAIENISRKRLVLELTSSMPDEISIYAKATEAFPALDLTPSASDAMQRREELLESLQESRKIKRTTVISTLGVAGLAAPTQVSNPAGGSSSGASSSTSTVVGTAGAGSSAVNAAASLSTGGAASSASANVGVDSGPTSTTAPPTSATSLGLAGLSRSSRHASDASSSLLHGDGRTPDYLDLASAVKSSGRQSPKRKPTVAAVAQLKMFSMHYSGRDRKLSNEDDGTRLISGPARSLLRLGTHADDLQMSSIEAQAKNASPAAGQGHGGSSFGATSSSAASAAVSGAAGLGSASASGSGVTGLATALGVIASISNPAASSASQSGAAPVAAASKGSSVAPNETLGDAVQFTSEDLMSTQLSGLLDSTRLPIDSLLTILEKSTGVHPPLFPRANLEDAYVKAQLRLRRQLDGAVQDGRLSSASTIEIAPESSVTIVLVLTASGANKPNVQGKPRKHDARVFLRLCEFDRDIKQPQFEQLLKSDLASIPVRELMLRLSLCRSIMELGQKNINFGMLDKNERRTKSIVIRNNSEAPLLYTIRKSGSIASGDIALSDYRMGIVRGYGKREVEFIFDPSLSGPFQERLVIENIHDRENDQIMTVKANIRQPANFFIEKLLLEFGVRHIDDPTTVFQELVISNTSQRHTRTFEVRVDPKELAFEGCIVDISFEIVDDTAEDAADNAAGDAGVDGKRKARKRPAMILSKEAEENIEQLEQKLKIAARKGRKDKIKRIAEKLERLRSGEVVDEYATDREESAPPKRGNGETDKSSSKTPSAGQPDGPTAGDGAATTPSRPALETLPESSHEAAATAKPAHSNSVASAAGTKAPPTAQSSSTALTSAAQAGSFKVKKTKHSIIFTIEPRCIKAVRVLFRQYRQAALPGTGTGTGTAAITGRDDSTAPSAANGSVGAASSATPRTAPSGRPPLVDLRSDSEALSSSMASYVPPSTLDEVSTRSIASLATGSGYPSDQTAPAGKSWQELQSEVCTVRIYVHEEKNTDIVKRVLCKATVCYDHSTYQQLLSEDLERNDLLARAAGADGVASGSAVARGGDVASLIESASLLSRPASPRVSAVTSAAGSERLAFGAMDGGLQMAVAAGTASDPASAVFRPDASSLAAIEPAPRALSSGLDIVAQLGLGQDQVSRGFSSTTSNQTTGVAILPQSPPLQPPLPAALFVEAPFVDLGRLEVGERKDCYVTLTNRGDDPIAFSFATVAGDMPAASLQFASPSGSLAAKETRRFDLWIAPPALGFQTCQIRIHSHTTADVCDVVFAFYGIRPSYLRFPSLVDSATGASLTELDFGNCYVDPGRKYATVVPFDVENVAGETLVVTALSNLAQQCLIFGDKGLEHPAADLTLESGERRTLYIALQPSLGGSTTSGGSGGTSRKYDKGQGSSGVASSGGNAASGGGAPGGPSGSALTWSPQSQQPVSSWANSSSEMASRIASQVDSRMLIGGIKFTVCKHDRVDSIHAALAVKSTPSSEGLMLLVTQMIKFSATIGQSLLMVSHGVINFGVSRSTTVPLAGGFWIYNLSSRMPLEYELRTTSSALRVSKMRGRIDAAVFAASDRFSSVTAGSGGSAVGTQQQQQQQQPSPVAAAAAAVSAAGFQASGAAGLAAPTVSTGSSSSANAGPLRERIDFWLDPPKLGFVNEVIEVVNLNNSLQLARVAVRLFVDPLSLGLANVSWLSPPVLEDPSPLAGSPPLLLESRPVVQWDNIYVMPSASVSDGSGVPLRTLALQKKHRSEAPPLNERSIEIENLTNELVQLQPQSPMGIAVRWAVSNGSGFVVDNTPALAAEGRVAAGGTGISGIGQPVAGDLSGLSVCGPTLLLHPHEKATAIISAPRPRPVYADDIWDAIMAGQKVTQDGILLFQNLDRGVAVKLVELSASYCHSMGEVRPTSMDLGKVGHFNMWKDVRFDFAVHNMSDSQLQYEIETPDAIDVVSIAGERDLGTFKRRIQPRESHAIEAVFKPRKVETPTPGPRNFSVGIVNVYNPRNAMTLTIAATMTQFELRFDRLTSGQLVLPVLTHPTPPNSLPCDTWFTIVNVTDEDVRFEIGYTLAPDVADLMSIEVMSRFSNSPVSGALSLGPKGTFEIKVRASALAKSRLNANETTSKYLTNPDGLTFGTLWVTSKNQAAVAPDQSEDTSPVSTATGALSSGLPVSQRMTETIPIRGTIVEGPTFTLSVRRIEFRSAVASDSDDEEDDPYSYASGHYGHHLHHHDSDTQSMSAASASMPSSRGRRNRVQEMLPIQYEDIVITNVSHEYPMTFRVLVEYPIELASAGADKLRVQGLDADIGGSVEPGGRYVLRVELLDARIGGVSEDVKVHIYDKNSLSRLLQTVFVAIVEDTAGTLKAVKRRGHDGRVGSMGSLGVGGGVIGSSSTGGNAGGRDGYTDGDSDEPTSAVANPPSGLFEPYSPTDGAPEVMRRTDSVASVRPGSGTGGDEERGSSGTAAAGSGGPGSGTGTGSGPTLGPAGPAGGLGGGPGGSMASSPHPHMLSENDDAWSSDGRSMSSLGPNASGPSSRHLSVSESVASPVGRRLGGHMSLRGCKKVADAISGDFEGLYELDLGQQDLGQNPVVKKLSIENTSNARVLYRIGTITENDRSWMVCSRNEGVLEAPRSAAAANGVPTSHTITLSFMVSFRGMFSTYLLVENIDNRQDTKIIRISMEVVAKQNVRRSAVSGLLAGSISNRLPPTDAGSNRAFDVFTGAMDWEEAGIDIDPAYLGCVYAARSIIICNRELVPLEFSIKSTLPHEDESEMVFSLSRTSAKLFRSITIEPESHARVFLRFWPGQSMPSAEGLSDIHINSSSSSSAGMVTMAASGGPGGSKPAPSGSALASGEPSAVEKRVEILVNCRLVKDYQKIIGFKAVLRQPQIMLSATSFTFSGMIRRKATTQSSMMPHVPSPLPASVLSAASVGGGGAGSAGSAHDLTAAGGTSQLGDAGSERVGDADQGTSQQQQQQQQQPQPEQPATNIIQFAPTNDTFSVTNLLQDTLEYEIVTDSMYFSLETVDSETAFKADAARHNSIMSLASATTAFAVPGAAAGSGSGGSGSGSGNGGGSGPGSVSGTRRLGPQPTGPGAGRPLWISSGVFTLGPMQSQMLRVVPLMDVLTKNADALRKEKFILEHMVLYNKRRPSEKYVIHVKLSFGNVDLFHFASGSRRSFYNIESHIIRLMHELEAAPAMYFEGGRNLAPEAAEKAQNTFFLYLYVIDELVHYGTREQGAEPFLQLATLLFTMLFSQSHFKETAPALLQHVANTDMSVWPPNLMRWVMPFVNFLGYFPHRLIAVEPLKQLARSLIIDSRRVAAAVAAAASASGLSSGSGMDRTRQDE